MGVDIQTYRCRIGSFCTKSNRNTSSSKDCSARITEVGNDGYLRITLVVLFCSTFPVGSFKMKHSASQNESGDNVVDVSNEEMNVLSVRIPVCMGSALPLRVIRMHLMISGLEPNPGPGSSKSSEASKSQSEDELNLTNLDSNEDGISKALIEESKPCVDQTEGQQNTNYRAKHEQFRTLSSRLVTFTQWPAHLTQRPEQMAEAGMFYSGVDDQCCCFACDGALRNWKPGEDPWREHCRWFPNCPYASEVKGDEYINLIQLSIHMTAALDETVGATAILTIDDTIVQQVVEKYRDVLTCDMGFSIVDVRNAILELAKQGNTYQDVCDIVARLEVMQKRKALKEQPITEKPQCPQRTYGPLDEQRTLLCHVCHKRQVNVLLLPCKHHMYCLDCIKYRRRCLDCDRPIKQMLSTYMSIADDITQHRGICTRPLEISVRDDDNSVYKIEIDYDLQNDLCNKCSRQRSDAMRRVLQCVHVVGKYSCLDTPPLLYLSQKKTYLMLPSSSWRYDLSFQEVNQFPSECLAYTDELHRLFCCTCANLRYLERCCLSRNIYSVKIDHIESIQRFEELKEMYMPSFLKINYDFPLYEPEPNALSTGKDLTVLDKEPDIDEEHEPIIAHKRYINQTIHR